MWVLPRGVGKMVGSIFREKAQKLQYRQYRRALSAQVPIPASTLAPQSLPVSLHGIWDDLIEKRTEESNSRVKLKGMGYLKRAQISCVLLQAVLSA